MVRLYKSLSAWGTPFFEEILKREIQRLDVGVLPLQQGLSQGSYSNGKGLSVMIIDISDEPRLIRAKTGRVVHALTYQGSPSDAQRYLRISEIM